MKALLRSFSLAAATLASTTMIATPAAAMSVQPVVIDLVAAGRGMSQVITVQNSFDRPLPVEMRVEELTFENGQLKGTGKDPGDIVVFPPQALIPPGQTQTFRVQYVGDPDLKASRHFYVTVAQLPVKLPAGQSAIQILYNFQVLVSVSPAAAKPDLRIASAAIGRNEAGKPVPVLTVANAGSAHGYLSKGRLRIVASDAAGKEVYRRTLTGPEIRQTVGYGLVGAGQTRRMTLPLELPAAGGKVDAQFTPEG